MLQTVLLIVVIVLVAILLAGLNSDRREREAAARRGSAEDDLALEKLKGLVDPLERRMADYDKAVRDMEKGRAEAYGKLTEQLTGLMTQTATLQTTTVGLRSALKESSARGAWGEVQLKRVVEMAGLMERVDFDTQAHVKGLEGVQRPDMVVKMPGGGLIAVDAKAPGTRFFEACEEEDDLEAQAMMEAFGEDVLGHVKGLGRKAYWDNLDPSPDFVVMFLPVEAMLGMALRARPALVDEAPRNNVILATPFTLVAALRAISSAWQQEDAAANAKEIAEQARELSTRVFTMLEHFGKVGRGLDSAIRGYNDAVGSVERRILPQTDRLKSLGAPPAKDAPDLPAIESTPRALPPTSSDDD